MKRTDLLRKYGRILSPTTLCRGRSILLFATSLLHTAVRRIRPHQHSRSINRSCIACLRLQPIRTIIPKDISLEVRGNERFRYFCVLSFLLSFVAPTRNCSDCCQVSDQQSSPVKAMTMPRLLLVLFCATF